MPYVDVVAASGDVAPPKFLEVDPSALARLLAAHPDVPSESPAERRLGRVVAVGLVGPRQGSPADLVVAMVAHQMLRPSGVRATSVVGLIRDRTLCPIELTSIEAVAATLRDIVAAIGY